MLVGDFGGHQEAGEEDHGRGQDAQEWLCELQSKQDGGAGEGCAGAGGQSAEPAWAWLEGGMAEAEDIEEDGAPVECAGAGGDRPADEFLSEGEAAEDHDGAADAVGGGVSDLVEDVAIGGGAEFLCESSVEEVEELTGEDHAEGEDVVVVSVVEVSEGAEEDGGDAAEVVEEDERVGVPLVGDDLAVEGEEGERGAEDHEHEDEALIEEDEAAELEG